MKLFTLTVGRNEAQRYLPEMMMHLTYADASFFYDDQSTDDTVRIAERHAEVVVRPKIAPSFAEDEGSFREQAWMEFEHAMKPEPEDWVLVIDCDEFLIDEYHVIWDDIKRAADTNKVAIDLNISEVFGWADSGDPLVRTDRLWGTIHAPRLFQYRIGGSYFHGPVGVPAVPQYVMAGDWGTSEIFIAHYGYAREEDRLVKYERYNGIHGHSNDHVQSILATDKILQPVNWRMG